MSVTTEPYCILPSFPQVSRRRAMLERCLRLAQSDMARSTLPAAVASRKLLMLMRSLCADIELLESIRTKR